MRFDKFAYQKAGLADRRLTPQERELAMLLCVKKTKKDGTGWKVKVFDLAAELAGRSGGGASTEWVTRQLNRLVDFGLLIERDRGGGGVGNKAWRRVDLVAPPWGVADPKPLSPDSETPESRLGNNGAQTQGFDTSEQPKPSPTGTYEGIHEGTGAVAAATNPAKLPSKCSEHINVEKPPPCRACGEARTAAETQAANRVAAQKRALAEAWDHVHSCLDCKGTSQIDVEDNLVKRCHCYERVERLTA